jgi:DNA-binding protein
MLKEAKGKGINKAIDVLEKLNNQKSFNREKLSNKG